MDSVDCNESKPKKCPPPQPSWGRIIFQSSFAAFMTTYIYGLLAVPAVAVFHHAHQPLGLYGYGALHAAILFPLGLVFNQFGGWIYFTPGLAVAEFFCSELRRPWMIGLKAFIGTLFAAGGFWASYATAQGIYNFSLHRASPPTHLGFFGDFFLDFIAVLLVTHVYCFSSREYSGVWGVAGISIAHGAVTTLLYPAIGSADNFWRVLAACTLEGNCNHVGWGPKLLAWVVAVLVVGIVKFIFWPLYKLKQM
jgi:hypothetical protein